MRDGGPSYSIWMLGATLKRIVGRKTLWASGGRQICEI